MKQSSSVAIEPDAAGDAAARWALLVTGLAAAVLFHLAGNPRPPFTTPSPLLSLVQLALAGTSVAVLLRKGGVGTVVVMCVFVLVSAWLEAPLVGNHWVLAAALAATVILAVVVARWRQSDVAVEVRSWRLFAPAGRLVLLVAYGFAAFAKLNADFFDPAVSCAVHYQDQLVSSWGLGVLSVVGQPVLGMATAVAAAGVELCIPLLLLVPRTRRIGIVVGLSFHWLLALDLAQHFWDFTSVLFVGFLLFADASLVRWVIATARRMWDEVRPAARRIATGLGLAVAFFSVAPHVLPSSAAARGLAVLAGHAAWIVLGTAFVLLVLVGAFKAPVTRDRRALGVAAPAMAVIPALVLANGLTPYLEIKTGFGWNMYSNLRTVDGETNHFLVPSTLDLTGLQGDTAEILDASDPDVAALGREDFVMVYSELREYAHQFPDEWVRYRRGGDIFHADRLRDDPAGRGGVSTISHRLQSFRVVDTSPHERCLTHFSPAR